MQSGTTSNEATWLYGIQGLISAAYLLFSLQWQGAKLKDPNNEILVLHGRRNLNLFSMTWRFMRRFGLWFFLRSTFPKTFAVFAKYNHEIYFRSNCLGLLHVTGLSSWWISSKIQFCLVCVCMYVCMHACVYVCMYVRTYVCMYVFMYVCVCMYVCMYVCIYVCMYVCKYVCR